MAVTAALGGHADQRPLILAGDLNDTAQAATSQLLLGPPGSELGTRGFDQHDNGDPMRLWNLAPSCHRARNTPASTRAARNSSTTSSPPTPSSNHSTPSPHKP